MEQLIQLNSNAKLSEHFTLGEFTKSGSHPEVYNIPSHEAIANLKRLCGWLEVLRKRYNEFYHTPPSSAEFIIRLSIIWGFIIPTAFLDKPSGKAERKMLILHPVEFQIRLNNALYLLLSIQAIVVHS